MIAGCFKDLGRNKSFDEAKHVGISAALNLAEESLFSVA